MATALLLLSRLAAPSEAPDTRITYTRHALDYWSRRAHELPWHRRAARREARMMVATARAGLIGAHLQHHGLGNADRILTPLLDTRGRSTGAHTRTVALTSIRRTALGRRILRTAAALAAASLASLVLLAALATHLLGAW
jgi:hypothetical protein